MGCIARMRSEEDIEDLDGRWGIRQGWGGEGGGKEKTQVVADVMWLRKGMYVIGYLEGKR